MLDKQQTSVLKNTFGFSELRPSQAPVIEHILNKKDSLVLMPTGGGKSLCYQFPALCMKGTAIVISPLIALMKDQVDALKLNGVQAAYLNSTLDYEQERWTMDLLRSGELDLLYLAPERLFHQGGMFLETLTDLDISLIAIDESHCISQWGHDFRPDYVMLGQLKKRFPSTPMIALTATADEQTKADILDKLQMNSPRVFVNSFDRPNIKYSVKGKREWFDKLLRFLKTQKGESGIIYCLSRKSTEELAEDLRKEGIDALAYHAGLPSEKRAEHQEKFIRDDVKIIVATIAFGMGIDKSNVRFVVHVDLPKNLEGYYQETGRAGRDGLPSEALLFYGSGDYFKLARFCEVEGDPEQTQVLLNKLRRMTDFADSKVCRRKNLLNYFGESHDGDCGHCDNCLTERKTFDATTEAQKLLSTIARLDRPYGLSHIIDILRGSKSEKISANQQSLSTYGIGKEHSKLRWMELGKEMIQLGLIHQEIGKFPTLSLNEESWKVLRSGKKVQLTEATVEHKEESHTDEYDAELFEALRSCRMEMANASGAPAYRIMADSSLREMAIYYPVSADDLMYITGFGTLKIKQYGQQFLGVIRDHLEENELESKMQEKRSKSSSRSRKKKQQRSKGEKRLSSTAKESLQLWQSSKDITAVAKQRNMTAQTIQRHLADCIKFGEIKTTELVHEEVIVTIAPAFERFKDQGLKVIKEHFKDRYSYDEIRFVQAHLERKGKVLAG